MSTQPPTHVRPCETCGCPLVQSRMGTWMHAATVWWLQRQRNRPVSYFAPLKWTDDDARAEELTQHAAGAHLPAPWDVDRTLERILQEAL